MSENQALHPDNHSYESMSVFSNDDDINAAARALKAMGHPLRLKILCALITRGETSVRDLVTIAGTSQSNISQHLSILREKSILECRKDANKVFYRIEDENIRALMKSMKNTFCA